MLNLLFKKKKKGITPRELRAEVGSLTTIDVTDVQLKTAAERQWKRFNDSDFQHKEFEHRFEKVFANSR
ncbi:hypothetical protein VYF65_003476 [Lysinibacillus irui]|uniref:hypothetical protein n=1 Tax=Lysinibacillus irui TaxID=2998077 RepID=UPI00388B3D13